MKKLIIVLTAIFFGIFNSQGQEWIAFKLSEATQTQCNVINSNDTIVEFEINVPGMFSTVVDTFNRVLIDEHTRMDSIGFPATPDRVQNPVTGGTCNI